MNQKIKSDEQKNIKAITQLQERNEARLDTSVIPIELLPMAREIQKQIDSFFLCKQKVHVK